MNKKWMKSVLAATALCCTVGLFGCSSQASETTKNEDGVIELTYCIHGKIKLLKITWS